MALSFRFRDSAFCATRSEAGAAEAPGSTPSRGSATVLELGVPGALFFVWGAEIALARLTSEPLAWSDVAISTTIYLLLAVGSVGLLRGAPLATPLRRCLLAVVAFAPLAFVVLRTAVPVVSSPIAAIVTLACALLFARVALQARRGASPVLAPTLQLALLAAATSLAWASAGAELPSPFVAVPLLAVWAGLAWAASRPRWIPLALVLVLALARLPVREPSPRWTAASPAKRAPDIVLLVVDTLRADAAAEMASYRRLARQGVTFRSAQAPSPWTLPSMATALTGVPIEEHGALTQGEWRFAEMDPQVPTLASRLAAAGYDTAAVVGPNPFVRGRFGFDRGFAVYRHAGDDPRIALPRADGFGHGGARPVFASLATYLGWMGRPPYWSADSLVDRALEVVARRRDRPLFLWVHFFGSHLPYRHADETSLPRVTRLALDGARGRGSFLAEPSWKTASGRAALWTGYRNEVRHVDRAIGRLLDALGPPAERGRVVVLTSDHGEEFFEHGGFEHGHAVYQEVVAIPLVIAGLPGGRSAGSVEATPVGLLDLTPTLLAAAGAPEASLPGQDLARPVGVRRYTSRNLLYGGGPDDRYAVREGVWKAIVRPDGDPELYDVERDPGETRDLGQRDREIAAGLVENVPPSVTVQQPAAALSEPEELALRALGYLPPE